MVEAIVVQTTAASRDEAEAIATALLKRQLAACVQIAPISSRYVWKGDLVSQDEVLLLIKTRRPLFPSVRDAIQSLHSYETPEIIATAIVDGSDDYLEWLTQATTGAAND